MKQALIRLEIPEEDIEKAEDRMIEIRRQLEKEIVRRSLPKPLYVSCLELGKIYTELRGWCYTENWTFYYISNEATSIIEEIYDSLSRKDS